MNCPLCGSSNVIKAGRYGSKQRVHCADCDKKPVIGEDVKRARPKAHHRCPNCGITCAAMRNSKARGKDRLVCSNCGKAYFEGTNREPDREPSKRTLVITSAVNDTPTHKRFLAAMLAYCAERDAELVVIPLRYKNPTSRRENAGNEYTWSADLRPYLYDGRMKVCKGLQLLADIKTQPTAQNPLTGLDGFTGTDCGIVGHTRVAMEPIATRGHELPKLMLTTGAVTMPEYSDTLAGKRGEFNHVFGAVVVEIDDDGIFHLRHIQANSRGEFTDLDRVYAPDGSKPAPRPAALVMGDIHAERVDPQALSATQRIIDRLQPRRLVMHDVLDFGSASHHNGYFEKFLRHHTKRASVIRELRTTCEVIDSLARDGMESVVVSSNHHNHLLRWLSDARNGEDVENAELYHTLKAETLAETLKHGRVANPFALAARKLLTRPCRFLGDRESYTAGGVELAYHGDIGSNGARGSAKAFDKLGVRTVVGHSHSPRIVGGCYQTGTTSLLDLGYNAGPSSWLHSHVLVYASGKRTHVHIIDGRPWREEAAKKRKRK